MLLNWSNLCYRFILSISFLCTLIYDIDCVNGCTTALTDTKSARRKVICGSPIRKIYRIPHDLPKSTYILNVKNQNISRIDENDFIIVTDLNYLEIKYSQVHYIHREAFRSLYTLEYLDLSGNFLTISDNSLPKDSFKYLIKLKILILSNNPLKLIPNHIFRPMSSSLTHLIINRCNTPPLLVASRAFDGLFNIQMLDLSNNSIKTLHKSTQTDFESMNLTHLYLSDNPWLCDCNIRWLYNYLTDIQNSVKLYKPNQEIPKCDKPDNLAHLKFSTDPNSKFRLLFTDFVCNSYCKPNSIKKLWANYGENINLTCHCYSDPIQPTVWRHNGEIINLKSSKRQLVTTGRQYFNSTLMIKSLDISDIGNWSCEINLTIKSKEILSYHFNVGIFSNSSYNNKASVNMYVYVGLGSSLLLISLLIALFVIFCNRENLCQYHNPHPMVICGYHENNRMRKPSSGITAVINNQNDLDCDVRFQYNQTDGRFTSFYENNIPLNATNMNVINKYQPIINKSSNCTNNTELTFPNTTKFSNTYANSNNNTTNSSILKMPNSSDKMLNMYCGCNNYSVFNSDNDDIDTNIASGLISNTIRTSNYGINSVSITTTSTLPRSHHQRKEILPLNADDNYQTISSRDFEKLFPKIKQCPFHGSSATLTRIPSKKPCPVHSSTSTLPSRLSTSRHRSGSVAIEHRHHCPKYSKSSDTVSVKSLKFDYSTNENFYSKNIHRSKSVGRIVDKPHLNENKVDIFGSVSYKPCPLHGNLLAALTENSSNDKKPTNDYNNQQIRKPDSTTHSKLFQDYKKDSNLSTKNSFIPNYVSISSGCESFNKSPPNINSQNYSSIKRSGKLKNSTLKSSMHNINAKSNNSESSNLKSPEQSSLSSSPLLASDVHGTLV